MKKKIYLLIPIACLLLTACKKDNDDNGSSSPYYFSAKIDGATVKYEADDLNSVYDCGISQPENALGNEVDIYEGTVFLSSLDPAVSNISIHVMKHFDHDPDQAERSAMVHTGAYNYGYSDASPATVDGASIFYVDANGDNWFSEKGPQSGSTFTITELEDNTTGTSGKIFKASFSCKLYNLAGTASIQVTNATVRGKILSP